MMSRARPGWQAGAGFLIAFGIAILVLPFDDAFTGGLVSSLDWVNLAVPIFAASLLWTTAYLIWKRGYRAYDSLLVVGWSLGLATVSFGITYGAILGQTIGGGTIVDRWLLLNSVTATGGFTGALVGYFHANADRDARRYATAYETVEEQQQRLLFLNRLLHHDIRNDVAVIHGYADRLAERHPDDADVETILRKSEEIEHLTNVARDITETADGIRPEPISLAPAIENALTQARDTFPHAEFRIEGDALADVSVTATDILPVVFENLLRNAAVHNGKPTPRVSVRTETADGSARVHVVDDGPGIPATVTQELFEPGRKGEASPGMGIGLYLVETLVTSYGGDVWIADSDDEGTEVVVELRRTNS